MFNRILILSTIVLMANYSFADEYLIPEDWDTQKKMESTELLITLDDFNKRIVKYFKTIPQCKKAKLSTAKLIKDGKNAYQEITLGSANVVVISDIADSKKLTNIKFTSQGSIQNNNDLQAMMCATYSIMRTLQPDLETQEGALDQAGRLWKLSKAKPFEMSYFFDRIKAQHVPFEMNVYKK